MSTGMGKVATMISQELIFCREKLQKAKEHNPDGIKIILARVEGYKAGLKTCLRPEYVDAVFAKEGF